MRRSANCELAEPFCKVYQLTCRLIDFFRFFSHDFQFNNSVLSLRAGPLTKESKGWVNDVSSESSQLSRRKLTGQIDVGGMNEMARDRNRLCIEVSPAPPPLSHAVDADSVGPFRDLVQCGSNSNQGWIVYFARRIHACHESKLFPIAKAGLELTSRFSRNDRTELS